MIDPFAPPPDEAQTAPPAAPTSGVFDSPPPSQQPAPVTPAPVVVSPPSEGKVVLTFKGGKGFEAPWIVIRATDLDDAVKQVTTEGEKLIGLMDRVKRAGAHFSGNDVAPAPANNGGGQQRQPQQGQPPQSLQAPGGEERYCQHGKMEFRSGVAKASGKPYKLFSCTADRDSQCPAQFLKDR